MARPLRERLALNIEVRGRDECWPWRGSVNSAGYGQISAGELFPGTRNSGAHRVVYRLAIGPIPDGAVIDHTCHTSECQLGTKCPHRRCENPRHLKAVTNAENLARQSPHRRRPGLGRTSCPAGHDYTDENTYRDPRGYVQCRTCRADRQRARRA